MSMWELEKKSKEVLVGLGIMKSLFLQFVTPRWGWQCASFVSFLHSLLQLTPSFALAGMILINLERERERVWNFKGKVKLVLLRPITKEPPSSHFKREQCPYQIPSLSRAWKVCRPLVIMFSSWLYDCGRSDFLGY